jgi:hypothetical protein
VTDVDLIPQDKHTWISMNSIEGDADISPLQLLFAILPFIAVISALMDSLVGM